LTFYEVTQHQMHGKLNSGICMNHRSPPGHHWSIPHKLFISTFVKIRFTEISYYEKKNYL